MDIRICPNTKELALINIDPYIVMHVNLFRRKQIYNQGRFLWWPARTEMKEDMEFYIPLGTRQQD